MHNGEYIFEKLKIVMFYSAFIIIFIIILRQKWKYEEKTYFLLIAR